MVGKLARDRNVKCFCYDKSLVNKSVLDVMKLHRYVRQVEDNELSERETHPVLRLSASWTSAPATSTSVASPSTTTTSATARA
jgi:glyceraldehyde 3-phosphate dehydrogenase